MECRIVDWPSLDSRNELPERWGESGFEDFHLLRYRASEEPASRAGDGESEDADEQECILALRTSMPGPAAMRGRGDEVELPRHLEEPGAEAMTCRGGRADEDRVLEGVSQDEDEGEGDGACAERGRGHNGTSQSVAVGARSCAARTILDRSS